MQNKLYSVLLVLDYIELMVQYYPIETNTASTFPTLRPEEGHPSKA